MRSPRNILIVDDSPSVRAAVRSVLEAREGLRVCGEAADGDEAIEKATELKPDLILLDLGLPKLNGVSATHALKRLLPDVPIVIFTMYGETAGKLAQAVGADLVIAKGEGVQKLIEQVQGLLDSKNPV
jgi:DNA-binding NarL/FixJ family response regulator